MDEYEKECYLKAGRIAREVKEFARGFVRPGMKLIDVALAIDAKIVELGGDFAFPVNLSLNEVAAHFTPDFNCEKIAEGLLKVDLGVCVDGYIADTAFSLDLTKNNKFSEMISLNEKILSEISKMIFCRAREDEGGRERTSQPVDCDSELKIKDVGDCVQDLMEKEAGGYAVIKSLSGHSLAQDTIHAGLTISNYRNNNSAKLEGAFAIEPFVTSGVGDVYEGEVGGIFVLKKDLPVRDKSMREVLKFIKERFKTRPFCLRFLRKENFDKLDFVIRSLVRQGILYEYPMLIEKFRKPVSQAENTFLIGPDFVLCTTD